MTNDTDYKRLWRKEKGENTKLLNLLFQANQRLETQAKVISDIKEGKIKIEKEKKNG